MKIIILCGGNGIRLRNQLSFIPKALIKIDDKPIIWHIMKRYSIFGFNQFVLALGKQGNQIRDYFLNYHRYVNDIQFTIGQSERFISHSSSQEEDWQITFVNTGEIANTGARLSRCEKHIYTDNFMLSYSDCLSNIDFDQLLAEHKKNNKITTVSGVMPPYRYGEFVIKKNQVTDYHPMAKLQASKGYVNGGFMVFNKEIFKYLNSYNECTLENKIFKNLVKNKELNVYKHNGFWQCLDNDRELDYLKMLCDKNQRFWLQKS
ncbi:MAG: sugar phosphate nucleotidyltransferase [Candidatus Woesebacteria bacterium]|jgi:glucose-1-phosphate cytidylyltransferase